MRIIENTRFLWYEVYEIKLIGNIIMYNRTAEQKFKTPANIIKTPQAPCFYVNKVFFFFCCCSGSCISKEPALVNVSDTPGVLP